MHSYFYYFFWALSMMTFFLGVIVHVGGLEMIVWPSLRVDKDCIAAYNKKELEDLISTPSWRQDRKAA